MSLRTRFSFLLLPLPLAIASPLFAGAVTGVSAVTGPGGSGSAAVDGMFATVVDASLSFTSVAPLSFIVTVDGSGGYVMNTAFAPSAGIANDTGVDWDGLLFQVSGSAGPDATSIEPVSPNFTSSAFSAGQILVNGGTLPSGDTYDIELGFATSQAGDVTVTYTPLTAATPLPNTAICGAAVLAGALCIRRRRSASQAAV